MKTKGLTKFTLTFIMACAFSAPLLAIEPVSATAISPINQGKLSNNVQQATEHENILQLVKNTNNIEEKCDNIFLDVQNMDAQNLAADLNKIYVEEFYSERHCMDAISEILEQVRNEKDMKGITKVFINKFGHPDNLIVSYRRFGGHFYRMTLLADWASSEYLCTGKSQQKVMTDFAKFLISEGANINEKFEITPGEEITIKDFIYEYGTTPATKLIQKTEQQNNK